MMNSTMADFVFILMVFFLPYLLPVIIGQVYFMHVERLYAKGRDINGNAIFYFLWCLFLLLPYLLLYMFQLQYFETNSWLLEFGFIVPAWILSTVIGVFNHISRSYRLQANTLTMSYSRIWLIAWLLPIPLAMIYARLFLWG